MHDAVQKFCGGKPRTEIDDSEVVCPYCGFHHADTWEWVKDDLTHEMNCDQCDGRFEYWAEFSVTYFSKPIEGEFNSGNAEDSGEPVSSGSE